MLMLKTIATFGLWDSEDYILLYRLGWDLCAVAREVAALLRFHCIM